MMILWWKYIILDLFLKQKIMQRNRSKARNSCKFALIVDLLFLLVQHVSEEPLHTEEGLSQSVVCYMLLVLHSVFAKTPKPPNSWNTKLLLLLLRNKKTSDLGKVPKKEKEKKGNKCHFMCGCVSRKWWNVPFFFISILGKYGKIWGGRGGGGFFPFSLTHHPHATTLTGIFVQVWK